MLESQLPSFNQPPTKTPKKPGPPPADTPAKEAAKDSHSGDTLVPDPPAHSVGPLAEGYATLDPNDPPRAAETPAADKAPSSSSGQQSDGGHTLDLPAGVSDSPDDVASRVAGPSQAPTASDTLVKPGVKRGAAHQASNLPRIPGYIILGELGKGGMGIVYKAMQAGLNRLVALKMIRKDRATEEAVARFADEAKAVARLRHPNIVQIYDIGEFEEQPYFSLEFVDGGSLDRYIQGNPQMPRDSALLVQTLAKAMQVAHEQNIVHRDLKPANILLQMAPGTSQSESGHIHPAKIVPKITDFGLAKQLDSADLGQTHSGAVLGTPYYMAPEQAEGWLREIKPWTDVYALGAILYELLTGRPPFKGATVVETLDQVRHLDPVAPRVLQPSVPRDLETICLKCLRKQPLGRYHSAGDLAEDLQRFLDDRPILGRPISWRERTVKWAKRSPMAAAAAGIAALLVLSLIGTLLVFLQVTRQQVVEQQRVEKARNQFEARMNEANSKVQVAIREKDPLVWQEVLNNVKSAREILDREEMLSDPELRERTDRLYKQAFAEVQGAQQRAAARKKAAEDIDALRACHDTAVVHSVLYTGLTGEQNYQAVEDEVKRALGIFGLNPGEPTPPALDPDFFSTADQKQILDWYYALLLFQAEATYRRAKMVKLDDDRRIRMRQAVEQLNRADRFRSPKGSVEPTRTNASLQRRVAYLAEAQDTTEMTRAQEQLARTRPEAPLDFFLLALERFEQTTSTEKEAQTVRGEVMNLAGKALQIDSAFFGARYLVTICQLQEGNLQVARDQLTACLKEQPKFIWLQLLRGFVWMQLGNLTESENDFNAARNHPNPKIRYVALVNSSALSTRLQVWDIARLSLAEAVAVMETGDKSNAPFPYPNYLLLLDPSVSAMTSLAASTHLRPGDGGSTTAYINLAMVNKKRAETPWTAYLLLLDPSLASMTALAARESEGVRTVVRRQALQDAVAALDRALEQNPASPALLYSERGRLHLELEDFASARADFAESICLSEEYHEGPPPPLTERAKKDRLSLAKLHFDNGNWRDTIGECQDLLRLAREQLSAYRLKARAELELGHDGLPAARRTLEEYLHEAIRQGIRQVPRDELADVYLQQGVLFAMSRDHRNAVDSCTQGLQLYRRDERTAQNLDPATRQLLARLYARRGWSYLGEDAAVFADKDFDLALSLDARNVDARVGKGESLMRQEKVSAALVAAEEAPKLAGRSARTLFSSARIYALAYGQALRGKRPADVKDADIVRWGERAIELLGEAFEQEPKERWAAFWKQNVETDNAFKPLRNQAAMERLEQRATGTPR